MASCVCRQWHRVARDPSLWQALCQEAFGRTLDRSALLTQVRDPHGGSWRAMYLDRPRLRYDGVYCSRNTYIKQGIREWAVQNAVHMVCYFRYYRFCADGELARGRGRS